MQQEQRAMANTRPRQTKEVTQEVLRHWFAYDPETGAFTRARNSFGNKCKAGDLAGNIAGEGYWAVTFYDRRYLVHRLIWMFVHGAWPDGMIDHINGVRSDNRLCNLRVVKSASENGQNMRKARSDNRSGYLGVKQRNNRFTALIKTNGKRINLGSFDTPQEAHAAYVAAKRRLHEGCTL
jgi:hypothetical protein